MDPRSATRLLWIVWVVVWLAAAFFSKPTLRREGLAGALVQRIVLLAGYLLLFGFGGLAPEAAVPALGLGWGSSGPWAGAFGWAGLALTAAGLGYSLWARACLGLDWSGFVTLKKGHRLVRNGPYAVTRHPIYTGVLAASLGLALERGTLGALLGLALVCGGFLAKMSVEEGLLREAFGDAYGEYASRVRRLIPFVY